MNETRIEGTTWRVLLVRAQTYDQFGLHLQDRLNVLSKEGFTLYRMEPMRVEVHRGHVNDHADRIEEHYSTILIGVRGPDVTLLFGPRGTEIWR